MSDEGWLNFHEAADEIRERLGVSVGISQRMLREVCATGDIRSWRQPYDPATGQPQTEYEPVRPSQWRQYDIDLATDADGNSYFVDVSKEDFRYWLDKLAKPKLRRTAPQGLLIFKALDALGLPDDLPAPDAAQRIGEWLAQHGYRVPHKTTIVRARTEYLAQRS
jgi:hypothetical protein